jgi:hypothetical protein|tara:strand:+ start:165 stop:380 length:216 start_codon:yes stop_codon:yes gene_type:complete
MMMWKKKIKKYLICNLIKTLDLIFARAIVMVLVDSQLHRLVLVLASVLYSVPEPFLFHRSYPPDLPNYHRA